MRTHNIVLGTCFALFFVFQNCSPVAFDSTELLNDGFNRPVQPNFVEMKAGPDQQFPPLKLVFVVDNSGTMGVNQINLSKAFEKMFEGDNASNLGPFESNAILITTAQASLDKNDATLARLPAQSLDQIAELSYPTLMSTYRPALLDGSVPGDIVGYRLEKKVENGRTSLDYWPAPVANFTSFGMKSRASLMVHLPRGGDIEAFKTDFRDRLALLQPDRSKTITTNGVTTGILDPVVDKESGLCAIARTLKNNQGLINPGELAAFVIVTDEDDADPAGARCLDAIRDMSGQDDLHDGRCERPQTTLSYRAAVANPSQPKCTVSYLRGWNYSYSYPVARTSVTYYREKYFYKVPRTALSYYVPAGYDYDEESTPVTYYTSAPTYQIPQTKITYYKEVENCVIRDGIKTNCTYTYPSTSFTTAGSYNNDCAAFVSGKLPADALTSKPGYEPKCEAATPVNMSGPCSATDTDKINCNQNYSTAKTTTLAGRPSSTCAAFVSGKLPAGTVYTAGTYAPTCGTTTVVRKGSNTGSCAGSLLNCVNRPLAAKSQTIDTTFGGSTTCAQFIKSKDSAAVVDQLATYPVSCTPAGTTAEKSSYGVCPTTNINVVDCRRQPEIQTPKIFDGVVGANQTCVAFAAAQTGYPSNSILTAGQYEPTCAAASPRTAGPVTASFQFTDSRFTSLNVAKNEVCPQALTDSLTASLGVAPSACTIGDPLNGSQAFDGMTCAQVDVAGVCNSSGGTKKNCTSADTPAGAPYETTPTVVTYDGEFSCSTKCSDTSFCPTKSGTVGDNYYACSATPKAAKVVSTFTAQKTPTCAAGDTKVVTNGPYRTTETVKFPVVDKPTQGTDKLTEYIRARSKELFGENTPFVSVFSRQPGDPLGTNGSVGAAYNRFAEAMGGQKSSVLSDADGYATALKGLSTMIRERLGRSFSIGVMAPTDQVRRVWHRRAGTTSWGKPVDESLWTSTGQTLSLSKDFPLEYGDEFRIEYW